MSQKFMINYPFTLFQISLLAMTMMSHTYTHISVWRIYSSQYSAKHSNSNHKRIWMQLQNWKPSARCHWKVKFIWLHFCEWMPGSCNDNYFKIYSFICAGNGIVDKCQMDQGGALVINNTLIGVGRLQWHIYF